MAQVHERSFFKFRLARSNYSPVRSAGLRCEPLEDRRLLATYGGVMENVSRDLVALYDDYQAYQAAGSVGAFASAAAEGIKTLGDQVMVTVRGAGDFDTLLSELQAHSFVATATASAARLVDGIMPIDVLPAVSALANAQAVIPIYSIEQTNSVGSVANAAENTLHADVARELFGVDGTGVTVGVISDSANRVGGGLADSIASGNLAPLNVGTFLDIDGPLGSSDEGRAMMELIHDIAPGATLRFASGVGGEASFATAVNTLVNNGADIIVDDLHGLTVEQFFIDGVASQSITTAVQTQGVTYINSAGNRGRSGYEAPVTNVASVTFPGVGFPINAVDFDAGPATDFGQTVTLQPGTTTFVFQHDQVWGSVGTDCDFVILNSAGTQILASGQNNDITTQTAREIVSINVAAATDVQVVVRHFSGPAPQRIKYVAFNRPIVAEHQNQPGAFVAGHDPGHGGNANAISIAAVNNISPTVPEVFTAVGPVTRVFAPNGTRLPQLEVRNKPDLTAPDGVNTSVPGFLTFFGTSAAAPNAAGVAALLLSRNPAQTPAQLRAALATGALDLLTPGFDLTTGLGLIDALGNIATVSTGVLTIDGDINAGNTDDVFELRVSPSNDMMLDVTINGVLVRSVPRTEFSSIIVNGLGGNDKLTVDSTNGLITVAGGIHFDGGAGFDSLELTQTGGAMHTSSSYQAGPNVGAGRSVVTGAAGTQTVVFTGLEPVVDLVPAATLIVEGTLADNAINYGPGTLLTRGLVTVDNFESIEFANKANLTINAQAGSDTINLNNPNVPSGLTGIIVSAGDPTGSDRLIVNGAAAAEEINFDPITTGAGAVTIPGAPTINYTAIETFAIAGLGGGDALTVTTPLSGPHAITLTPGATSDSGTIRIETPGLGTLAELEFTSLGNNGALTFEQAGGNRTDSLTVLGTNQSDAFEAVGESLVVFRPFSSQLVTLPIDAPGVNQLRLIGLGGNDAFSLNGPMPYTLGVVDGGDSADQFVLNGNATPVNATIGASDLQVFGGGLGFFSLSGIEGATLNANSGDLIIGTTSSDDVLTVTPTSLTSGTLRADHSPAVVDFGSALQVTVDLGLGSDQLIVNGSANADEIAVSGNAVAIADRTPVGYQRVEFLTVNAGASTDVVTVTPSVATSILIDGGDPIGVVPGDTLNIVTGGNSVSFFAGPQPDEGAFQIDGNAMVSFDHIETIGPIVGPGPALIVGTNADDDITVIARDSSTHPLLAGLTPGVRDFTVSVNTGPDLLFVDVATLYVDALSGDDDIVLRTPASNNAQWNVNVFIAGGPPSASDRLVLETPGSDTIVYTPTGSDTGTVLMDEPANDSLITIGPFSVVLAQTVYVSSPGGVEHFVYDGEGGTDSVTIAGDGASAGAADQFTHTPGGASDEGRFRVNNFLAMDYQNLGPSSSLRVDGGLGVNSLLVDGAGGSDQFSVNALGTVTLALRRPIAQTSIQRLVLHGFEGDDAFSLFGVQPFDSIQIEGGGPSASDVLAVFGDGGAQAMNVFLEVSTITGFGSPISFDGVEQVNLIGMGGADSLTVGGNLDDGTIVYTPTADFGGTFRLSGSTTSFTFNIGNAPGNVFTIEGGSAVGDEVQVQGTNNHDVITVDSINRRVSVQNAAGVNLKPIVLGETTEVVTALGLLGNDTFLVIPAPATFTGANGFPINLLVNIDGGQPSASDALVIADAGGVPLLATDFVVVNRGQNAGEGVVRVFRNAVQMPDIAYVGVEVVSPSVAVVDGDPNLLILGPDNHEPNEFRVNAEFLGAGSAINVANLAVFPNAVEHPFVPGDNDFFRVVAQQTGTLDFQVYFRQFSDTLLPQGGDLDIQVLDAAGNVIAGDGAFGNNNGPSELDADGSNERVRIPAVAGQTYYLRVFGRGGAGAPNLVVNGYNLTVINTPPPVPFDIELLDFPPALPGLDNSDTGRSQFDNVTFDSTPTILFRLDDANFLNDLPGNGTPGLPPDEVIAIPFNPATAAVGLAAGFRVAIFDETDAHNPVLAGFAQPVAGQPGVYSFTFVTPLSEGSHFVSARVQMIDPAVTPQQGFGLRSPSLEIVVDVTPPPISFGATASATDGLDPASDSGVNGQPATFNDRITSDTAPTLFGAAEANAIVRLYADLNNNGQVDAADLFLGQSLATPDDGSNQLPDGQWSITSLVDLNAPAFFTEDGTRRLLVTAEDLAGNVSPPQSLTIFIDTRGPQVVPRPFVTGFPAFDLFANKPTAGPTPLVNRLTIPLEDLPNRDTIDFANYLAVLQAIASQPGQIVVRGDHNGIVPIKSITVAPGLDQNGQPARADIIVEFFAPLPDDRFTLFMSEAIVDPAGNALDGEANAPEPSGSPLFPTGDGQRGGSFSARFTVDSRPELGTFSTESIYVDINGNFLADPTGADNDFTNRDLAFSLHSFGGADEAFTSSAVFAAKLTPLVGGVRQPTNGFDNLGAYGLFNNQQRWLIDTDGDGVADVKTIQPAVAGFSIDAYPVAGNFDGNAANGDEVGLFDGTAWLVDLNGDYVAETLIASPIRGLPIVGDFDGDGLDDLAAFTENQLRFDLAANGYGQQDAVINFGFPGVLERPVAADMDGDGIDDVGLWVPGRSGSEPRGVAEWYFLISNDPAGTRRATGSIVTLNHEFSPAPLGSDLFAKLGDEFGIPLVGNFDPPLIKAPTVPLDTAALYNPATGVFFLQDKNAAGLAAQYFQYGPGGAGWTPLHGDWNNDGAETVALYNPVTGMFYLRNSNTAGVADIQFQFGPGGSDWQPLVGDWDNDGTDTIGLYNAASGVFFLKNNNTPGAADLVFGYGVGGAGWRPLVGDWDNDGIDTVGVYVPASGNFFLRNAHAGGVADVSFNYGPGGLGWTPVIGDWDQDGDDNVGLYSPGGSVFFLKNTHAGGPADQVFSYGPPGAGWTAMAGAWTAPFGHALRLSDQAADANPAESLSEDELQPVLDAAIARWAAAGLDAQRLQQLRTVEVVVTDLPGNYLGWAEHGVIYLDRDAAGAGWHIDATPDADEEFVSDGDRLRAIDASLASDVDLLTVLAHELGHELGLDDLDGPADGADLMTEALGPGRRRLPTPALVDRAFGELDR